MGMKDWWVSKSAGSKTIWVLGAIGLASLATYLLTRKKDDESTGSTTNSKSQETISENTETSKETQHVIDVTTLPNQGVGCGTVKLNYDRDFDYVKCDNVWYAKSKPNAASQQAKGLYKEWTSIQDKTVATERLNRRYPNG